MKKWLILLVFSILLIISGCRGGGGNTENPTGISDEELAKHFDPTLPAGIIEFTHYIMDIDDIDRIIPLGSMNPPGHIFPTDHIYLVLQEEGLPVYAPAGGKILHIERIELSPGVIDCAIRVGVTNTMTYYIAHIKAKETLQVGDMITAGVEIGKSLGWSCVDFGVINKNVNNAFISKKYPINTLYGDKPLSYYNESLRTNLYSLVKPASKDYTGGVTDGRFVYDVPGTLCGNWFQEGCLDSVMWYENEDTLTFAYDNFYPDQIRIAIGKNLIHSFFALKNEDNPIKPEHVTTASGRVAYYLYEERSTGAGGRPMGERIGLMMVQMLSDTRLKLEIFIGDTTSVEREFTDAAWYYVRDPIPR